jgi:hypothetical protein
VASAACSDGFFASTMPGEQGGKGRAVLLMAQSSPVVPLYIGRVMLSFGGGLSTTGGDMRLPWFYRDQAWQAGAGALSDS